LGISFGGDEIRLELFRPLQEGAISNDWMFYLRILEH
jgi:hypothetical protein